MGGSEKNLNFPPHQKMVESGFQMGQPLTFLHSFSTLHPPIWSTTVLCGKKNLSSPVVGPLQPEMAGSGGTDRSRCILCHDMCAFIYHTRRSTRIPVYIYLCTLIHTFVYTYTFCAAKTPGKILSLDILRHPAHSPPCL